MMGKQWTPRRRNVKMLTYLGHFPRFVGFISGSTLQYLSSSLTGHIVGEPAGLSQPLAVMLLRSLDPTRK